MLTAFWSILADAGVSVWSFYAVLGEVARTLDRSSGSHGLL